MRFLCDWTWLVKSEIGIMKRVRDLLWSNSDTSKKMEILREKVNFLAAREADVLTEIENAEVQPGKRRREEVVHWMNTVKAKKAEVQSIEKECQQQATSSNSQLFGRIERVTKDVHELIQQGRFPNGLVLDDHKCRALPFPIEALVGEMFHQHSEKIMGWLKNSEPFLIGLYGMGGVGKTTLLKYIHNHLVAISDIVESVFWVTVSQDCCMYRLQHKIFRAVTGLKDFDEKDEERREVVLHKTLTKMGKTVIILDDLWEPYMLGEIGIPLRDNSCKIILSSRSLEVCRRMGCAEFTIKVKPLSTNEAWELFVDKLQNYEALAAEVKPIVALVTEECSCLPLAIITTAVSMRGVFNMPEWENALNEIKNPCRRQHNTNDDMFAKLKFSYDRLNDEMMQTCFLSCVLYPEDSDIDRRELIELWIAEGLLKGMGSWQEQLNKGHTILNKLENSCLLEQTTDWFDRRCVKMHDMIRDMCIIITRSHPRFMAKSGLLLKEVPEEEQWTEDLVKVSLRENKITETAMLKSPLCSKLSILMLCRNPLEGIPESFFFHMQALTVIDLSYTLIQRLPDSICGLENLRALFLRCCEELIYVPSLSKLTKLTLLDFGHADKIREAPRGMEHLKCLKKVNCPWNLYDLDYFHRLGEYRHFSELDSYEFWLHGGSNAKPYCVEPDGFKTDSSWDFDKRVMMSGENFGQAISTVLLPSTIQFLAIFNCDMKAKGSTVGDMLPSLSRATELKSLYMSDCKGLRYISSHEDKVSSNFDKLDTLEFLHFFRLHDFEDLIEFGKGSETLFPSPLPWTSPQFANTFSQLKKLFIQECHKLKVVFPFKLLQHQPCFPNLEEISVIICSEIEEIFESSPSNCSSSQIANGVDNINLILKLPKLRSMHISHLPKLCSICKGLTYTPLKSVVGLTDCPNFGRIYRGPCLVWDDSLSTLASINSSHLWQCLYRDYPGDALDLSSWVNRRRFMAGDPFISSWTKWINGVQEDWNI